MPQINYRANVGASTFPLIAENFGRSVIVPQYDNSSVRAVTSEADADQDVGVPQLYYAHNVMPTAEGVQSVGFDNQVAALSPVENTFTNVHILRDAAENKAYFSHTSDGRNFISIYPFYNWVETTYVAGAVNSKVTVAHISGVSYIYFSSYGCYKYDFASNSLIPVTLSGLTPANILGIVSSSGYLIAYSETAIAWSSTLDPTDFIPSSVTGAGGGSIAEAKGKIVFCAPASYGFIIFTTKNAVGAAYSGNSAYPFNNAELHSSGGLASSDLVSFAANAISLFAYTSNGLQEYAQANVRNIYPEITDFIAGSYFEDFDESTLSFIRTSIPSATMKKQVNLISNRYLVISYGITELTHAIIVDISLKRFGKVKITHVDCFEWAVLSPELVETPRKSIAFIKKSGEIQILSFDPLSISSNGFAIFGKYQFIRRRLLELHTVYVDNIRVPTNFKLYQFQELEGKEVVSLTPCTLVSSEGYGKTYGVEAVARSHSLALKGNFQLSTLELRFSIAGVV